MDGMIACRAGTRASRFARSLLLGPEQRLGQAQSELDADNEQVPGFACSANTTHEVLALYGRIDEEFD